MEKAENDKWNKERESKIYSQQTQLLKKHEAEMSAFLKKVESGLESLKKKRACEEEALIKKFQNMKKTLESQQITEMKKCNQKSIISESKLKSDLYKGSTNIKGEDTEEKHI